MPDAQQPNRDNRKPEIEKHVVWAKSVINGVTKIISGRRGVNMPLAAKLDLCACMDLLSSNSPLEFDWDISLYLNPPIRRPSTQVTQVGTLPGYKAYVDEEESDDNADLDPIERPEWNLGEVRIVQVPTTPFWTMTRYIINIFIIFDVVDQ